MSSLSPTTIRKQLQEQIASIRSQGWRIDANQLQTDLERCGDSLPELLITRDCVEEFLASIATEQ